MVAMDFLHFHVHKNITSGLKNGWCDKHRNVKENETMTIEIIRSSQIKAFFLSNAGRPPMSQSQCNVSIQEREKQKY